MIYDTGYNPHSIHERLLAFMCPAGQAGRVHAVLTYLSWEQH